MLCSIVLADQGQKKSPTLNRFLKPIREIQEEIKKERQLRTRQIQKRATRPKRKLKWQKCIRPEIIKIIDEIVQPEPDSVHLKVFLLLDNNQQRI